MILDIVIILLIALSVYLGYKRGLINLAIKLVALVISLVVTMVLYNPIASFVVNVTNIDEALESHIYEKVIEVMQKEGEQTKKTYLGISAEQVTQGMLPKAARELAVDIVRFAVFIILLVGLKIGLRFINALANSISGWPIISKFNKIGGGLYGVIRGILVMFIVLFVIELITKTEPENIAYEQIEKTYITKVMYENNPISFLF